MDTKALRQKILDLAIRGKLVPQDPNDEPASVLLERIREQKQQMVKEGKLKKKDIKNDSLIFVGEDSLHYEKFQDGTVKCIEDEIPFELPEGWSWCRLLSISEVITKGASPKWQGVNYQAHGTLFVTSENVYSEQLLLNTPKYVSPEINRIQSRSMLKQHDILTNIVGASIGRTCEYNLDEEANTNQAVAIIRMINLNVVPYVLKLMNSDYIISLMLRDQVNVARANLSLSSLGSFLIPLPPLREQEKIAIRLSDILSQCELIDVNKTDISGLVDLAKSKILDLAIRGKLIPQDPNDEPASVLLERIRTEKEGLIKQGKIKRDKKESVIFRGEDNSYYLNDGQMPVGINDDLPFDIPDSWRWTRLKDIFIINPRNKLDDALDVSFIPMPLIDDGYSGKHTAEVRHWKEVKTGFTHFAEGDIGIAKITPCFENRKSTVFENLVNGYGAGTTELHVLRPLGKSIFAQYLLAYVKSDYFIENGKQTFTGAVGQQRIGKEYVENAYFPLPPVKEQERIVQQISDVFEYLNTISEALS